MWLPIVKKLLMHGHSFLLIAAKHLYGTTKQLQATAEYIHVATKHLYGRAKHLTIIANQFAIAADNIPKYMVDVVRCMSPCCSSFLTGSSMRRALSAIVNAPLSRDHVSGGGRVMNFTDFTAMISPQNYVCRYGHACCIRLDCWSLARQDKYEYFVYFCGV